MLNSIGNYISRVDCNIEIPRSQPCLCSRKVLTMGFIVGDEDAILYLHLPSQS